MPEAEETVTRQRGARVAAPRCRPRARVSPLEAVACERTPPRASTRDHSGADVAPLAHARPRCVRRIGRAEENGTRVFSLYGTPRRPTCRGIPPSAVKATERRVGPRPGPLRRHPPCVAAPWLLSRARRRTSSTPRHPRRVPVRPGAASRVSGRRSTRRRVRGRARLLRVRREGARPRRVRRVRRLVRRRRRAPPARVVGAPPAPARGGGTRERFGPPGARASGSDAPAPSGGPGVARCGRGIAARALGGVAGRRGVDGGVRREARVGGRHGR